MLYSIAGSADEDCGVHSGAEPQVQHVRGGGAGAKTLGLAPV